MIELRGVSVVFGGTLALDEVDLALGPGIVGLFGPNGSGKSTLLRTIAGLVRPARGEVLLDGRSIARAPESVRRRLGFAGHTGGLYGPLSAVENLVLFAKLYGTPPHRTRGVIEDVGLAEHARVPVKDLSAGLQRRVALARALLHEPDVLLLDEPYANLDDEASDLVSAAIVRWRQPGRVAVVAGHGAKRIKSYADASVVLRRGTVASHRVAVSEGMDV